MAAYRHLVRVTMFVLLFALPLLAQQPVPSDQSAPCAMPVFTKVVGEPNIFSEQQEEWLGEIMDQGIRQDFNIVEDPDGYLQKLGERLLAQLPPTAMHYHFVIIDSPELNSFGVAGGRIYIHRRMIAFTKNEGELAALLGHEIGHVATHQVAIEMSRWLHDLGVTQVGDRQDVLKKWNLFRDNAAKIKDRTIEKRIQDEQLIADRVGFYAMTRAGYDPGQFIEFADRVFQTKGKTGNFWSDFFGRTSPESRRLREIIHNSTPLPASCIAPLPSNKDYFAKWQQDVIASKRAAVQEELPGLISKVALHEPLRGDIHRVEFSPDGKYLLAQDESSVFVLTREPLANVFRIDALDAHAAQFSPDSNSVVFYDKELRVEKWEIATQQRTSLHALTVPDCYQSSLSPSGEYMACVEISPELEFGIELIEVNTNKTIYSRKKFYTVTGWSEYFSIYMNELLGLPVSLLELRFSPDSRYFLAGHRGSALAYDLKSGSEVHLPSHIRELMDDTFAFVSSEEIAGVVGAGAPFRNLMRARFPSGEKIDEFKFPIYGHLYGTSQSNYLLMRTVSASPVGIVDLNAKKVTQAFRSSGFAIYGQFFAGEEATGEIGLFSAADHKRIGRLQLPESPLASARASAFSPDGKWLAVSGPSRGSLWQLETGERIFFTQSFEGAYFDHNQMVAKFAKHESNPESTYELDPTNKGDKKLYDLDAKTSPSWQQGKVLITLRPEKGESTLFIRGNFTLEVRDVRTNALLWDKKLGKAMPRFFCNENILTLVVDEYDSIKAAAKENPSLSNMLNTIDAKRDAYLIQAFETTTGKLLGSMLVDTGKLSFKVTRAVTVGDTVLVTDSHDRVLVYSLKSGEQRGKVLGHILAASPNGDRMLVGLDHGVAEMYDTNSLQVLSRFGFPSRISDAEFTQDGAKLMVLTADQTVYQLKSVPEPEKAQADDSAKTDSTK